MVRKLEANEKGPYKVTLVTSVRVYVLSNIDGQPKVMSLNAPYLKKYHF